MNTDKATPRPWRFALDSYGVRRIWGIIDGEECDVASCHGDGSLSATEEEANASLIVKAVNSHDALVTALECLLIYGKDQGEDQLDVFKQAKQALARAGVEV